MEELTGTDWMYSTERRRLDITLASSTFIPIMIETGALATLVALETRTIPILVQDRVGTNGDTFRQPKVRSYKSPSDFNDTFDPLAHQDRLSRVGAFARSRHLDDLVSIINILKGDLSFWGPRPLLQSDIEKMRHFLEPSEFDYWFDRYSVSKKGWIGPFQVWGAKEVSPNTPDAARARAYWDSFYADNASKSLDRRLLADASSRFLPMSPEGVKVSKSLAY